MASTQPAPPADEAGESGDDFVFKLQPKHKAAFRNFLVCTLIFEETFD